MISTISAHYIKNAKGNTIPLTTLAAMALKLASYQAEKESIEND